MSSLTHLETKTSEHEPDSTRLANAHISPSPTCVRRLAAHQGDGDEPAGLRLVLAVGGNALQRRGDRLTFENQLAAAKLMAPTLKHLAERHTLVLTHGNGPQVGELALQRTKATFDVLGAESQATKNKLFKFKLLYLGES